MSKVTAATRKTAAASASFRIGGDRQATRLGYGDADHRSGHLSLS